MAQVLSELGDYAARLALSMLVYERTGSASLATVTLAMSLLPWVGPGQLLATLADRFGRRVVMVTCDLVRAATYLALCLPIPLEWLLVLTFVAGLAAPPFGAARSAAMAEVVPAPLLGGAYRLAGITQDLSMVVGSLVGGVMLALVGPVVALQANATSFVVSALVLARLPPLRVASEGDGPTVLTAPGRLRLAVAVLWRDRLVRRVLLLANLAVASGTAVEMLVVPHAAAEFGRSAWVAGAIWAATSAVSVVVTAATPTDVDTRRLFRATTLVAVVPAAVAGAVLLVPDAAVASLGFVAAGGLFAALVPAQTIIGPRLPAPVRATAFAVLMGVMALMQVVLVLAGGALADEVGARTAAAMMCAPPLLAAAGLRLVPHRARRAATAPTGVAADLPADAGQARSVRATP